MGDRPDRAAGHGFQGAAAIGVAGFDEDGGAHVTGSEGVGGPAAQGGGPGFPGVGNGAQTIGIGQVVAGGECLALSGRAADGDTAGGGVICSCDIDCRAAGSSECSTIALITGVAVVKHPVDLYAGRWRLARVGVGDLAHQAVDTRIGCVGIEGKSECARTVGGDSANHLIVHLQGIALDECRQGARCGIKVLTIGAAMARQGKNCTREVVGGGEFGVEHLHVAIEYHGRTLLNIGRVAVERGGGIRARDRCAIVVVACQNNGTFVAIDAIDRDDCAVSRDKHRNWVVP